MRSSPGGTHEDDRHPEARGSFGGGSRLGLRCFAGVERTARASRGHGRRGGGSRRFRHGHDGRGPGCGRCRCATVGGRARLGRHGRGNGGSGLRSRRRSSRGTRRSRLRPRGCGRQKSCGSSRSQRRRRRGGARIRDGRERQRRRRQRSRGGRPERRKGGARRDVEPLGRRLRFVSGRCRCLGVPRQCGDDAQRFSERRRKPQRRALDVGDGELGCDVRRLDVRRERLGLAHRHLHELERTDRRLPPLTA